jgi:hypothetical protein
MHPPTVLWSTENLQTAKDLLEDIHCYSDSIGTNGINKFLVVKEIEELNPEKLQKKEDNFWLNLQ